MTQAAFAELFERRFESPPLAILPLEGDGSARKMFRLVGPDHSTAIGVFGPDPDENRAFLSFSRTFRELDLPVPEIYGVNEPTRVYIEEDLGDTTLFDALRSARQRTGQAFPASMLELYRSVVAWLPRFQVLGGKSIDFSMAYPRAAFDRQSILWDLNYFKYHFLKLAGIPFREAPLERDFRKLTAHLLRADRSHFLYRDFQSRNVMVRDGKPCFIDYQGGRRGALQYDLASILYDAKAGLPEDVRALLFEHYLDALEEYVPVDREEFREQFGGYLLIRILQAMGAYGYRGFFERKIRFLQSVPPAIDNIERLLARDALPLELPELRRVLEAICASSTLRQQASDPPPGLTVHVGSFSYKHGYPEDVAGHGGGYVFDLRAIHNPGRYAEYTELCGLDTEVVDFLENVPEVERFWDHVRGLVEMQVDTYLKRGFNSLSVQFGCTGGQHRSVYFAERLGRYLREHHRGLNVIVAHRERNRWPEGAGRFEGG